MRIVSVEEMRRIDAWAHRQLAMPTALLMENAGRGAVEALARHFDLSGLPVLIICGKGNNGGDGLVAARHLAACKSRVKVVVLAQPGELKGDARLNYEIARRSGFSIIASRRASVRRIIASFRPRCIIDAIYGTGLSGAPPPYIARAMRAMNDARETGGAFVFALDIPSGVNGDTGATPGAHVCADATAAMCLPKRGHFLYPGAACTGKLHLVNIGVPVELIDDGYPRLIQTGAARAMLPRRPADGHKGTFGSVLVIGGSRGYSGAAALTATSALRAGAGLVRLAAPRSVIRALEGVLTEVVKLPLAETEDETISSASLPRLAQALTQSRAIAMGPGVSTHPDTARLVMDIVRLARMPLVIDADAITILARKPSLLRGHARRIILTPHPGEMSRLIGLSPAAINDRRIEVARETARQFDCVIVLKGVPTVIAAPGGECYINTSGDSGMGTAGSGDVLTGLISGFLAQGAPPLNAAVLGVHVHGLSGEIVAREKTSYAMIARDLGTGIPRGMQLLLNSDPRSTSL